MIDTDKEVKDILFDLGVEGNEYGDLVEYISKLLAEVKRLRKLEAAVVGSWMRACDHRGPWHKALRGPCVDLGYFELRDVEHTREGFDGNTFTYTSKDDVATRSTEWC